MASTTMFRYNLKNLRYASNITQFELASLLGVTENTVRNWERGVKKPSMDALISLSMFFKTSIDRLVGIQLYAPDNGDLFCMNQSEYRIIQAFRNANEEGKNLIDVVSKYVANTHTENRKQVYRKIPLYDTPSAAGLSIPIDGQDYTEIEVTPDIPQEADFAVKIQGKSMAPWIGDGDIVYVKRTTDLKKLDIGIFCVDGAMYCKQYWIDNDGSLLLVSLNQALRETNVRVSADSTQSVVVYGKVLLPNSIPLPDYLKTKDGQIYM